LAININVSEVCISQHPLKTALFALKILNLANTSQITLKFFYPVGGVKKNVAPKERKQ